ncbi:MAG TPA: cytochrome P450 [Streptosporangiaceae bacterium]|nr:cytochrome P450 [Streptosporangiaceae bacterium]
MDTETPLVDVGDLVEPARFGARGQPHDTFALLRRESPVHWCAPGRYPGFWAVTRHRDIKDISLDYERFSSRGPVLLAPLTAPAVEESLLGAGAGTSNTILGTDPPEHRDYRDIARPYFRPSVLRRLEDRVREISRALLDRLADREHLDFVTDLAAWHPLRMLCEILGVERRDEGLLLRLSNEFMGNADPEFRRPKGAPAARDFGAYLTRLIADRRANPRDDLAGVLARARLRGEPMSDLDTVLYLMIIAVAGHDTTRSAIAGGMLALIDHPEQLRLLRERPELCDRAADEIVRWTSPVVHFVRTATRDCEVGGRRVRAGQLLALFYPSANRDEEVFADPFAFRVDRSPNPHLGWGFGEHYCLGANLARMEIRVLLEELVPRLESVRLAGPPEWMASRVICGPKHLPISWRLRW